jgi:hypothetical protein
LIPAQQPHHAHYKHESNGRTHFTTKPVIAWDDDGRPLVLHSKSHRLVLADSYSNFHGVSEAPGQVVAAIPGGGWKVVYEDDGELVTDSVLLWLVRADGSVTPMDGDRTGDIDNPLSVSNFKQLLAPGEELPES